MSSQSTPEPRVMFRKNGTSKFPLEQVGGDTASVESFQEYDEYSKLVPKKKKFGSK
jgi:hypothetical protein